MKRYHTTTTNPKTNKQKKKNKKKGRKRKKKHEPGIKKARLMIEKVSFPPGCSMTQHSDVHCYEVQMSDADWMQEAYWH